MPMSQLISRVEINRQWFASYFVFHRVGKSDFLFLSHSLIGWIGIYWRWYFFSLWLWLWMIIRIISSHGRRWRRRLQRHLCEAGGTNRPNLGAHRRQSSGTIETRSISPISTSVCVCVLRIFNDSRPGERVAINTHKSMTLNR